MQIHDPHIAGLQVKIEMNIPMLLIETPVGMRLIWLQILLSYGRIRADQPLKRIDRLFLSPTTKMVRLMSRAPLPLVNSSASFSMTAHWVGLVSWASSTKIWSIPPSSRNRTHWATADIESRSLVFRIKSSKSTNRVFVFPLHKVRQSDIQILTE